MRQKQGQRLWDSSRRGAASNRALHLVLRGAGEETSRAHAAEDPLLLLLCSFSGTPQ